MDSMVPRAVCPSVNPTWQGERISHGLGAHDNKLRTPLSARSVRFFYERRIVPSSTSAFGLTSTTASDRKQRHTDARFVGRCPSRLFGRHHYPIFSDRGGQRPTKPVSIWSREDAAESYSAAQPVFWRSQVMYLPRISPRAPVGRECSSAPDGRSYRPKQRRDFDAARDRRISREIHPPSSRRSATQGRVVQSLNPAGAVPVHHVRLRSPSEPSRR
jgi:hypothetical protein